jgi:hypothetical protein
MSQEDLVIVKYLITVELSDGTSLQNAEGIHCRRCDMRSSDLMGGELFIISLFFHL